MPSFLATVFCSNTVFNGEVNMWDVSKVTNLYAGRSIRMFENDFTWRGHAIEIGNFSRSSSLWRGCDANAFIGENREKGWWMLRRDDSGWLWTKFATFSCRSIWSGLFLPPSFLALTVNEVGLLFLRQYFGGLPPSTEPSTSGTFRVSPAWHLVSQYVYFRLTWCIWEWLDVTWTRYCDSKFQSGVWSLCDFHEIHAFCCTIFLWDFLGRYPNGISCFLAVMKFPEQISCFLALMRILYMISCFLLKFVMGVCYEIVLCDFMCFGRYEISCFYPSWDLTRFSFSISCFLAVIRLYAFCCTISLCDFLTRFHACWPLYHFLMKLHAFCCILFSSTTSSYTYRPTYIRIYVSTSLN